jgi:lysophospholipase L1-like esterase
LHDSEGQEINKFIKRICQKSGIPFVDITPKFEMESNPSSLYLFPLDAHTSPKGHKLIADSIVEKIKKMGILENVKISYKLKN